MARKRKHEVKTSVKSSPKYTPIRKSSRQIAKKQLEERKINGKILKTSSTSNAEESRSVEEIENQMDSKKNQNVHRKYNSHKNLSNSDDVLTDNVCSIYKRDDEESDSQDGLDNLLDQSEKLSPEDVRQMVVGNTTENNETKLESTSNEVEVWPEEVIEEIICEEMEVESDATVTSYNALEQDSGMVVEQVLLMNKANLEGDNFVEYTVIKNEDGTQSMVVESKVEGTAGNEYQIIQNGMNNLRMTVDEKSTPSVLSYKMSGSKHQHNKVAYDIDNNSTNKKVISLDCANSTYKSDKMAEDITRTESFKHRCLSKDQVRRQKEESNFLSDDAKKGSNNYLSKQEYEDQHLRERQKEIVKGDNCFKSEKSNVVQPNQCSKEIEKLVNDLCSVESVNSPVETCINVQKISLVNEDDESSSSILDKMEQLHRSANCESNTDTVYVYQKSVECVLKSQQRSVLKSDNFTESVACASELPLNCRNLQKKKTNQKAPPDHLQNIEDVCADSEADSKVDSEDMKLTSSGDSSNDTLLSINNYKIPDIDTKGAQNNMNDLDKKVEFRSRSGSTDTTGSESGSNSSGVRRSNRIRTIGLMKQRSRGRGLVTKSTTEILKANSTQEKDKITAHMTTASLESKINMDGQSVEIQCDKENNANKMQTTHDPLAPLVASFNTSGYNSDSLKPVKVKSRWRRSSELEMGGSSSSISGTAAFELSNAAVTSELITHVTTKSNSAPPGESASLERGSVAVCGSMNVHSYPEIKQDKEENLENNSSVNSLTTQVPKIVGIKTSPIITADIKNKEMEERLSQFEYLRENLYLTERYTNKETKRMVCDCFLTEEEIERGELGCGEDCLNRLLMIECGSRCVVGDRCTNKRFQNCEYAKCEVFKTEKKGFGLRAVADLDVGEFIMEYVGEVVDPKDFRRRAKEYSKDKNRHYYFMALKSDQIIDATMKGNVSRFINHSCDPNAETQKWTVNGELRIGFFIKKFIAAGEEITFNYHFQRYGKEAQKCFCEAPNCCGWIGDTPEEEIEKIEKKEKREKDARKKKEEKKSMDYMEDEDLEEEIDKLCSGGLKNRAHTLTLSRLMVRSRELKHRTCLLRLIQSGEQPCRRLFLDYHGLRLIWSYVMDIAKDESEEAQQFRLEILKTLNTLPIPNKTMLMDSKIYGVVEKWSNRLYLSPNGESPEDDQVKVKRSSDEGNSCYNDGGTKKILDNLSNIPCLTETKVEHSGINEIKSESTDQSLIPELASTLLAEWSNLKEVFRIPKKERIEQMKEHEREADRGYREELEKDEKAGTSYERHRSDRYGRAELDKRTDRRRGRESPEFEHNRTKDKKGEERSSLVPIPRMTKYERRQLFALKVAKEEEERQRRQQHDSWQEHEARCLALGIDPHSTAMLDPQTGYPVFYNPTLGQWQHYSAQEGDIAQQCTSTCVGGNQSLSTSSTIVSQNPHALQSTITSEISTGITGTTAVPSSVPPVVYSLNQASAFNQTTTSYSLISHHQQYPEGHLSIASNLVPVHGVSQPISIQSQSLYVDKTTNSQQFPVNASTDTISNQAEIPPIDLPPKWKSAIDARGRRYYYHIKERVSQWLPPPPDHIGVQPDSSSTSESSDDSTSSNEDEEDLDDDQIDKKEEDVYLDAGTTEKRNSTKKVNPFNTPVGSALFPETKKRRDGLVQERIISPRREEDRIGHKTYKELKEKLRRQKERARLKMHVDKLRKHRRSNKSKVHSRHWLNKPQSTSSDFTSSMSERKIKDTFRINMANVMVHFLNPYRKNDCKQGRITNTEDFKHLARKLTHFVLAKELKHCKSVDELQCNENVKHKAKDFVRKYMSKFGAVYQKGTDED
ncbi:probable histone-lysine N-methyltransferase CG1716 isoform X1 [Vespa velutina]|uniref:probable histone-lysine N-methyltransferase CG1716 isoform X1 n=2 Tax=Vespa velutina TaxID=202808 RepID=UPI001FB21D30|nr:probable histone-lysine N-methyltransferase CG1716 isoform X1 [Vespa velutina]XP_047367361.1 probable histone-lysine N-methyltransferase CG1716 isoform X1 [Vespa velutina]XP_047367362.1 probable histone-lysine N-methyltransferase CG1716 isoform X1 [Vespa velutina]XP_047367363.1 probable histone-lysine N-methyltransferase CG1716 isoform X1 [Vespa velutina]XP_047367364.1 probable histone-lysine N-methyltransferase CG1716 isoform X1 [Vespa velutina]XP_047367365.1 probable histone-lysine N-meth